jgi:hypothetical protein
MSNNAELKAYLALPSQCKQSTMAARRLLGFLFFLIARALCSWLETQS